MFLYILVIILFFVLLGSFIFSSNNTVIKEDINIVYDLDDKDFIQQQKNLKNANNIKEDMINYCYVKNYANYKDLLTMNIGLSLPKKISLEGSETGFLDIVVYDNYLKNLDNNRLKLSNIVIGKKEDITVELFLEENNNQAFTSSAILGKEIKFKREVNLPTKSESYHNSIDNNNLTKNIKLKVGKGSVIKSIHCEFNIKDYSSDEKNKGTLTALITIPFYDNRTNSTEIIHFKKILN